MDREKQGGKDMRDAPASAEQKTVKRAMRGNVEAYGVLIREQKEYLYRTAYLYSGNEEDALKIVQETVLRAFRSIRNLKDPAVFRTWITRILINVSKDYYKREQRYEAAAGLRIPQEKEGISSEERMDLYSAIGSLPEKYRTVVILRYFDELKLEEIAYITGIPRGTVSVWLTRARQELRRILKEGYLNE